MDRGIQKILNQEQPNCPEQTIVQSSHEDFGGSSLRRFLFYICNIEYWEAWVSSLSHEFVKFSSQETRINLFSFFFLSQIP